MKQKVLAVLLVFIYAIMVVNGIYSNLTNNQTIGLIDDIVTLLFLLMGGLFYIVIVLILFFWDKIKKEA